MEDQKMEDQKRSKNRKCRTENTEPKVSGGKCRSRQPGPENGRPTAGS